MSFLGIGSKFFPIYPKNRLFRQKTGLQRVLVTSFFLYTQNTQKAQLQAVQQDMSPFAVLLLTYYCGSWVGSYPSPQEMVGGGVTRKSSAESPVPPAGVGSSPGIKVGSGIGVRSAPGVGAGVGVAVISGAT